MINLVKTLITSIKKNLKFEYAVYKKIEVIIVINEKIKEIREF